MKNWLAGIGVAANIALNAFASPEGLNEYLSSGTNSSKLNTPSGVIYQGRKDYFLEKGRQMHISATKYSQDPLSRELKCREIRTLEYAVSFEGTNTLINIVDNGADGLSIGDTLDLTHNFSTGHTLRMEVEYPREYSLKIRAEVYKKGKLVSKAFKDSSKTLNIPIIKQIIIDPLLIGPEIESRFKCGNSFYYKIIDDIISGKDPSSFPYDSISAAFSKIDPKLNASKEKDIADVILSSLSDSLKEGLRSLRAEHNTDSKSSELVNN